MKTTSFKIPSEEQRTKAKAILSDYLQNNKVPLFMRLNAGDKELVRAHIIKNTAFCIANKPMPNYDDFIKNLLSDLTKPDVLKELRGYKQQKTPADQVR